MRMLAIVLHQPKILWYGFCNKTKVGGYSFTFSPKSTGHYVFNVNFVGHFYYFFVLCLCCNFDLCTFGPKNKS